MWAELHEQADVVEALLARLMAPGDAARALVGGHAGPVLGVGRGTSDNALRYAQYVWGQRLRLPVGLAIPSLHSRYGVAPRLDGTLAVGVSQSGRSPDLLAVLEDARRQGRPALAITNAPDSPLADVADAVVDLAAGPELAVAATKTYTAQLAAVAGLAAASDGATELAALPALVRAALARTDAAADAGAVVGDRDRCMVVGRGMHFATAHEWALKLQELTNLVAQAQSAADLRHGPIAAAEEGLLVLVVATAGAVFTDLHAAAEELRARGAHVVALTDDPSFPADAHLLVPSAPEWLAPIVAAPALQAFAHGAARARGLDPDRPRGLDKVTLTS